MTDTSEKTEQEKNDSAAAEDNVADAADEEDLEKLQAEIAKMEEEAAKIAAETANLEKSKEGAGSGSGSGSGSGADGGAKSSDGGAAADAAASGNASGGGGGGKDGAEKASVDQLSIYVGQVDYSATPEELLSHFEPCGTVERVTINCDKFTGAPKGFAYLEFQTEEAVENAIKLDGSSFKGRTLKVTRKRVNDPNYYYNQQMAQAQHHGGGGRGYGGRGGFPGRGPPGRGFRGRGPPGGRFHGGGRRGGFGGRRGGFRGGYNGGGGGGYHPYY